MLKILPIMLLSIAQNQAYYAENYAFKINIMLENQLFYEYLPIVVLK